MSTANVNIWHLTPAWLNQSVLYIFKLSWYTFLYFLLKLKARKVLKFLLLLVNSKNQKLSARVALQKKLLMQLLGKSVLIAYLSFAKLSH